MASSPSATTAASFFATDHLTNPAHPLFLHPGENPALILVNPPLSDNNYQQWRHDMIVALETKNKDKFVLGTISCPPPTDVLHEAWKRCNKMVISWLTRSMTLPIKQSVMWMDFASAIWNDLYQRFSHGDKFRIVDLQEALQSCKQGDSTVSQYYTRLQIIWKELSLYQTVLVCTCKSPCNCGLLTKIQQERNDDSVIKFLRGLNDEFSQVRSQIMLMEPMPILPKTFSLVLQQEREFHHSSSQIPQDSMANVNFQDPQNKTFNTSRGAFSGRGRGHITKFGGRAKYCDHCKRTNHTSDNCWIKYGLPQGYKPTIKMDAAPSNTSAHLTDSTSLTPTDSTVDKTHIQCHFTQEQYDVILDLLKQPPPPTPRVARVNQCTPQSSGFVSNANFSSWIIDSGATDHICSSKFLFKTLQPITPISIRLPNQSFVTAAFSGTVILDAYLQDDWSS
ncbi:uncharacterized protein LOC111240608 [Vigna radiata var. radiata]|uniref:Uncharacterized protein LOC111240608 n=1 Tax=Vigna radiata var. radiata TaxID=3916 RepID=A0A3Q0EMX2_VIGRR|nr:uncharacterized protein LOC111240608 [Vigna radiata var. radiata]